MLPLYASTLFVSAFLLFLVQPMVGKMILPTFGGTPAVWNTCMVFFQTLLFGGYASYALDDTWEYDGTAWERRTSEHTPAARISACATYDSTRAVTVLFGGRPDDKELTLSDTWEWDGADWTPTAKGPPGRRSCAMAFDAARNAVVMFGGTVQRQGQTRLLSNETWIYE